MKRVLSILAVSGIAACTSTTTGGSGGGTTSGTTTTVSVPCTDCVSQTVTWGWNGGLVSYTEESSVSACRTYKHTQAPVGPYGTDAGAATSCSVEIGGCDAGPDAVHDVEQAIAQPDVIAALAGSVPVYGADPRPCDGAVMQVTVGSRSILVGEDCATGDTCFAGATCVPVPAALSELVKVLAAVDKAALAHGECATAFP